MSRWALWPQIKNVYCVKTTSRIEQQRLYLKCVTDDRQCCQAILKYWTTLSVAKNVVKRDADKWRQTSL